MSSRGCEYVALDKPLVWKCDDEWVCTQNTECRTCHVLSQVELAAVATWAEAMEASKNAREVLTDE